MEIEERITRCKKRGYTHLGTIWKVSIYDKNWVMVDWDEKKSPIERPQICHIKELEILNVQSR